MSGRDESYNGAMHFAAPFDAVAVADRDRTAAAGLRGHGTADGRGDTSRAAESRRRLRGLVDRLFASPMPRTTPSERAKRLSAPSWRPLHPRFATGGFAAEAHAAGGFAASRNGVLDWADAWLGLTSRRTATPRVIMQLFGLIVMLTLVTFGTSFFALSQMSDTLRTIGLRAKPAITAAERVRTTLGAMDVDAASDSLLGDAVSTGTSREFAADVGSQIAAMIEASADLPIGDGDAATRIQTMQYDMALYYSALGEAREAGHTKPWIAAQRVKFASRLLRSYVMVQADAFERGNRHELDAAYIQSQQQSLMLAVSFIGIGTLLGAALIGAQIFLVRRTRRMVNVPLAIATLVLVVAIIGVGLSIRQERADLDIAKTDALARLVALRQAKTAAYALNADQALWLIDHEANRADYVHDFDRRSRLMLGVDPADEADLAQLQAEYSAADPAAPRPLLTGLLGSSFADSSPADPGRAPTAEAITAFLDFLLIDKRLHRLEDQGDHRGALEVRTGRKPGQSLFAFGRLEKPLDAAIDVADASFEQHLSSAVGITAWLQSLTVAALGLGLLLAAAGLWQRYQEYR